MTAPTINGTRYPQPVDALLPAARTLADELGEVPSRNRLMREYRIGAPKAGELLDLLRAAAEQDAAVALFDMPSPATTAVTPTVSGDATENPDLRPVFVEPTDADPGPDHAFHPERVVTQHDFLEKVVVTDEQVAAPGHPGTPGERGQLLRVRWAVRAVLALGVAASIAGNVLHARDELISQIISAWSPLALLLTVELISRVPVHRRMLAVARWIATAVIAGIAAWVSYFHMAAVASRYGETNGSQYLLPLSVDGLVVVASICLVELGGRIAATGKRYQTQEV